VKHTNTLNGAFRLIQDGIFQPFVRMAIVPDDKRPEDIGDGEEVDALVDTGSFLNLVSMSVAEALLEKDAAALKKGSPQTIGGVSKKRENNTAWGWEVNLLLRGSTASTEYVVWRRAMVYATEINIPYNGVLLGQKDGLQDRAFIHLNCPPKGRRVRGWTLRPI
jgi:hypothetical protein